MSAVESLYLRADEIRPGDILPDVSRFPVATVKRCPMLTGPDFIHLSFQGAHFTRRAFDGGPGYGFECFRVERAVETQEEYERSCSAQHAANAPFRLEGEL